MSPTIFEHSMSGLTLVALYAKKDRELRNYLQSCQDLVAQVGGDHFKRYDMDQIHMTLADLSGLRNRPSVNSTFFELRRSEREMNLAGLLDWLRKDLSNPLPIGFGGFKEHMDYGFESRGRHPYARSFSCSSSNCVLIGWPKQTMDRHAPVSERLVQLRKTFETFGVLHRYHESESMKDNDAYLRLGTWHDTNPDAIERIEERVRRYLVTNTLDIYLDEESIQIVRYTDSTLPLEGTIAASLTNVAACAGLLHTPN